VLDLGGPRPCTGELEAGPEVVHWDPRRDDFGSTLSPARLWLVPEDRPTAPVQPVDAVLPVSSKLASLVDTEDRIRFKDARGRRRELRIRGAGRSGCLAESDQTTFLESGAPEVRHEVAGDGLQYFYLVEGEPSGACP